MVKALLLLSAFLLAVALVWVVVWALRDRRPWPRKPHLGHWRKWGEDENGDD